jgi:hypothetical protein
LGVPTGVGLQTAESVKIIDKPKSQTLPIVFVQQAIGTTKNDLRIFMHCAHFIPLCTQPKKISTPVQMQQQHEIVAGHSW